MESKIIEVSGLTSTEMKVYCLNGVGKQTKEIADMLKSSYETAKSHMKNIKAKLGLQKDKEVTAHFWCTFVGKDFDEVKKIIISSCLILLLFLYMPVGRRNTREIRTYNASARRITAIVEKTDKMTP